MPDAPALRLVSDEDPYFRVYSDRALSLVVLRRTRIAYPTTEAILGSLERLQGIIRPLAMRRVMMDMRDGPVPRNAVTFEHVGRQAREDLSRGFEKTAFLMGTAVGVLQASRLTRDEERQAQIFRDEAEAIAWLTAAR